MTEINDVLSKVGLTDNEMNIYNSIVAFGMRTSGQISAYTGLELSDVLTYCEALAEKKYLIKVKSKLANNQLGDLFIPLAPKISISGDISKRLSERLKSLSTKVSDLWGDAQGTIDGDTTNLIQTVKEVMDNYTSIIQKLSSEHQESIDTWSEDVITELTTVSNEAQESFKAEVTTPLVEIADTLNNLAEQVNTLTNNSVNEIQSKTDLHKTSIETAVSEIKTELGEFSDEIGFLLTGAVASLNQTLENIASEKSESADTIFTGIQTSINTIINEDELRNSGIANTFAESFEESYNASKLKLFNSVDDYLGNFNSTIQNVSETGTNAQSDAVEGSQMLLDKFKDAQIGSVEDLRKSFIDAIQTVQKEAVTELSALLGSTSEDLRSLEENIISNLNNHQETLNGDLNTLTSNVSESLKERFNEIEKKLSGFIGDLKGNSQGNVDEIISSINDLKDFLHTFLDEVSQNLASRLSELQEKVENDVGGIVSESNNSIGSSLNQNKEQIEEIRNKIDGDLDTFQNTISDLLTNVKSDLENRLIDAQTQFKQGVDEGVTTYQNESDMVAEIQEKQIREIEDESSALLETANKSREKIVSMTETSLNSIKDENMNKFKTNITSNVEKFNRQFTSFNDTMNRDFKKFYEEFQDKSTGLRENVPEEINTVFTDQIDRISKFKADFERISSFIDQTFGKLESDFSVDSKVNLKKERENYFQEITRNKDEFTRLGDNISSHFSNSMNDLEMTKNDLLDEMNKTVQDELVEIEQLIENKTNDTKSLMEDFKGKLENNKDNFVDEVDVNINETMRTVEASITKELLSVFQQPLDSILSKARSIATGTEGMDQENRLIKTQKSLVSSIQEAVDVLVNSLQTAFENSITDLDQKVSSSIEKSSNIVNDLKDDLSIEFEKQNNNASSFAESLSSSLGSVEKSLKENLNETVKETKSTVDTTVNQKKDEIGNTVVKKTGVLQSTTSDKLVEVDESFNAFKDEFNTILIDASKNIDETVNSTIQEQKSSMDSTIQSLTETNKTAIESISNTQNSLQEKVGTPLSTIETDVSGMTETFNESTKNAKEMIAKQVSSFYEKTVEYLNSVKEMGAQLETTSSAFKEEITSIGIEKKSSITSLTEEFKMQREGNTAMFKDALQKDGENLTNNTHEFIQESFAQIADNLSMLQQQVISSIENVKNEIDLKVTNSVETVRTDILGPANEVVNALTVERDNVNEKATGMATKFSELEASQHSVIGDAAGKFNTAVEKAVNRETEKWKTKAEGNYSKQTERFNELAAEFENKISSVTTDGKQKVTDAFNTIPKTIDETLDASAESMKLLNEISQGSIKLDPKYPELSYFDASKEAITSNLNSVLMNTKSSALIISPKLDWVDIDQLSKMTRASIRIVTDPSQHSAVDSEIVQKMKDSDVNIALKKHDKNLYRGDLDFIFVTRDREEMIISKMLSVEDPYAFVSQDDTFIEKFTALFGSFNAMREDV